MKERTISDKTHMIIWCTVGVLLSIWLVSSGMEPIDEWYEREYVEVNTHE
jgi:hypothetical protein